METGRKMNGIELKTQKRTHIYLIFGKGEKNIQWRKDSIFNKPCWINSRSTYRKMQIDPFLSPYTKFKSKWIKDLYIKPDILKLIKEKVGTILEHMDTGEKFQNRRTLRTRIYKWDLIKLHSFCKAWDMVNRTKQ